MPHDRLEHSEQLGDLVADIERMTTELVALIEPKDVLTLLGELAALNAVLQTTIEVAVVEARVDRATWKEIGSAVGCSPQNAFKRWSRLARDEDQ